MYLTPTNDTEQYNIYSGKTSNHREQSSLYIHYNMIVILVATSIREN